MSTSLSVPGSGPGSPASAVFDLPTQHSHDSQQKSRLDLPQLDTALGRTSSEQRWEPSCVLVSGGTGGNAICSAFPRACYALPVSDDGGSSSEIIRVLGGPSIGDIRSRLVRLIPPARKGSPLDALRMLLAYRLPANCSDQDARAEWRSIVEGRSPLWTGIPPDRKEAIRGFLVYFENEVLRRSHKNFSFRNGSIGNCFLAAAQGFFRSLPSAIFLFSSVTNSQASIIPVIVTNHTVTIAAELDDGQRLVGQCEISHPVKRSAALELSESIAPDAYEDAISPSLPVAGAQNIAFTSNEKEEHEPLDSPIHRLYYINAYGQEIYPLPNPDYIASLSSSEVLVYSCGSLWTSIVPCLALKGVGPAIAQSSTLKTKVLFLNSRNDRETAGYTAIDYMNVIARTLSAQYHAAPYGLGNARTTYPTFVFINHLVYLRGATVPVDVKAIERMDIRCIEVESSVFDKDGIPMYDANCAAEAMRKIRGML